jgi:ribonuclease HII
MTSKNFDIFYLNGRVKIIAGVDEAGRGPLAGPVVAAAVIFSQDIFIEGIDDSKRVPEQMREKLYDEILDKCVAYGFGIVKEEEIDKINILQASLKAMRVAAGKLKPKPDLILIDGNKSFASRIPTKTIIKGDTKSFSIAAASILAKVKRDRIMRSASKKYPDFLWHKNKGYGTREHIDAIRKKGITPLHRKSFLSNILENPYKQFALELPDDHLSKENS